jgi:hypothetical protein
MAPFFLWKRGNGQYYMTVLLPDGKKQYRSLGTKDKATAQETAQRLIAVIPQAPPVTPQLSDFLKDIETCFQVSKPAPYCLTCLP